MAIYYVDPLNGSDVNGGTNPTTDQWKTTKKALDNVSAGDEIRLMNTTTEVLSAGISETTNGTSSALVTIIGADSSGDALTTGHYVIDGSGSSGSLWIASKTYYMFKNIRLTSAALTNMNGSASGGDGRQFINCRFDNAIQYGVSNRNPNWKFVNCEIDNNGYDGFYTSTAVLGTYAKFLNCAIHSNGRRGINVNAVGFNIVGCQIYENTLAGVEINTYGARAIIKQNAFYNNGGNNIYCSSATPSSVTYLEIINNIFSSSGAYGLNVGANYDVATWFVDYNCFYANTSNPASWQGVPYSTVNGNGFGDNNVSGDPLFTNVTAGSEDFTTQSGSPLRGAGYGYNG